MKAMMSLQGMAMNMPIEGRYYTVSEAARILDVSPITIWRWIEAKKLPGYRVGPRNIRIKKEDLESMIKPARGGKEPPVEKERVRTEPVAVDELARRKALVAQILSKRKERVIAPLTTAELVRKAREGERVSYGR